MMCTVGANRRVSRWYCTLACPQRCEGIEHLSQACLAEGLDAANHRDLQMNLLVRCPLHPALRLGELLDQFKQLAHFEPFALRHERRDHLFAKLWLDSFGV